MDDKVYVLYIDLDKIDMESAQNAFNQMKKIFPEKTCICLLPEGLTLTEVDKSQLIKDLQTVIETLSQE